MGAIQKALTRATPRKARLLLQRNQMLRMTAVSMSLIVTSLVVWASVTMVLTESLSLLSAMRPSRLVNRILPEWNSITYINVGFAIVLGVLIVRLMKRANTSHAPSLTSTQPVRAQAFRQSPVEQSIVINISELESELHEIVRDEPERDASAGVGAEASKTVTESARSLSVEPLPAVRRHHHHF